MKFGGFVFGETVLISTITQWIIESMRSYGQFSVFIGVIIEQIIVPIPSPLIIMGAGVILIPPEMSIPRACFQILWTIVLPGSVASTLGSYIGATYEKAATRLDSAETIVSITMLTGMGVAFGYLYYKFRRAT